MARNKWLFSFT